MRQLNLTTPEGITKLWVDINDDGPPEGGRKVPATCVLFDRWTVQIDDGDPTPPGVQLHVRLASDTGWKSESAQTMPPDHTQIEASPIEWKQGTHPFPSALVPLRVRGQFFERVDGQPWTGIQCSDFHLFGRYLAGEDIGPVLAQRAGMGFNLLRVWTRYDIAQIGRCTLADHPDLYDRLPAFLALCAGSGLYVELTAYTGHEDWDPDHWTRLGAACQGVPNVLLELVNEADQPANQINGESIGAMLFLPIAGVLCSHGSNGSQARPVEPFWDFVDFHTNGAPQEQRKVGHNAWEVSPDKPVLTSETSRFPEVGMYDGADQVRQEQVAHDAAAGASLLCAGSCFHSVEGKTSQLFSAPAEAVGRAWVAGARSVPLECQPGDYRHRTDLEPPDAGETGARTYQRGDERACIVPIRP